MCQLLEILYVAMDEYTRQAVRVRCTGVRLVTADAWPVVFQLDTLQSVADGLHGVHTMHPRAKTLDGTQLQWIFQAEQMHRANGKVLLTIEVHYPKQAYPCGVLQTELADADPCAWPESNMTDHVLQAVTPLLLVAALRHHHEWLGGVVVCQPHVVVP